MSESVVNFVVSPSDLDGYLHMNNGRYLTIMDLGRLDLMMRNGILRLSLRRRWQPVVASATLRFKKELAPFARFRLRTRFLCWEGYWLFIEAVFQIGERIVCRALIKMVVLGSGARKIAISDLAIAAGHSGVSPPLPPEVAAWQECEKSMRNRDSIPV